MSVEETGPTSNNAGNAGTQEEEKQDADEQEEERRRRTANRRFFLAAFHRPPVLDTVREALQQGADVNVDFLQFGALAIDVASLVGHVELMRTLLQAGAKVNHVGRDGFTALHRAALTGNLTMAALLLTATTTEPILLDLPTHIKKNPLTSLQIACRRGPAAMAELLIRQGANVHIRDAASGETLAHVAQTPQLLECLQRNGVNLCLAAESDGFTPLHYACLKGNLAVVQYLVTVAKAPVHQHSEQGYGALHYACHEGHLPIVQWLVQHGGADPRAVDDCGNTAFHICCTVKHFELAVWFMDHCGFSAAEEASTTGLVPLHYACLSTRTSNSSDGTALVRALLQRQQQALDSGSIRRNSPVLQLLLQLVADWSPGICRILVDEYRFDSSLMFVYKARIPLQRAARQGTAETVAELCRMMQVRGLDVNTPDAHGWTALHSAVAKRDVQMIGILLDAGCCVHAADVQGQTPLQVAARRLACPSTETPRDKKSNNDSDKEKEKQNVPAEDHDAEQGLEIMQMLLKRGANPCRVDAHGRFPLSEASTSLVEVYSMVQSAATLGLFEQRHCRSCPVLPKRSLPIVDRATRKRMKVWFGSSNE